MSQMLLLVTLTVAVLLLGNVSVLGQSATDRFGKRQACRIIDGIGRGRRVRRGQICTRFDCQVVYPPDNLACGQDCNINSDCNSGLCARKNFADLSEGFCCVYGVTRLPGKPVITQSTVGLTSAMVEWEDGRAGEPEEKYVIKCTEDSGSCDSPGVTTDPINRGVQVGVIGNLTTGQRYSCYVIAENSVGQSCSQTPIAVVPNLAPGKPTGVQQVSRTSNEATIQWVDGSEGDPVESYMLKCVRASDSCSSSPVSTVSGIARGVQTGTIANVPTSQSLKCYVVADNGYSSVCSDAVELDGIPSKPTNVATVFADETAVRIQWTDSSRGSPDELYEVKCMSYGDACESLPAAANTSGIGKGVGFGDVQGLWESTLYTCYVVVENSYGKACSNGITVNYNTVGTCGQQKVTSGNFTIFSKGQYCATSPPTKEDIQRRKETERLAFGASVAELTQRSVFETINSFPGALVPVLYVVCGVDVATVQSQLDPQTDVLNQTFLAGKMAFYTAEVLDCPFPTEYNAACATGTYQECANFLYSLSNYVNNNLGKDGPVAPVAPFGDQQDFIGLATLGLSYYPFASIDYRTLPGGAYSNYDIGHVLTHEVGHAFSLYHTFQGGCSSPGDSVADTPYEASPNFDPTPGRDTCTSRRGLDPVNNYLDYSIDCVKTRFSPQQILPMQAEITVYRPQWLV